MNRAFHLSLPAAKLRESVGFFVRLLGARLAHDAGGYVNLELGNCQLTLHDRPGHVASDEMHLGLNLALPDFDALVRRLQDDACVVKPVTTVDAGTPMARRKMYLRCPSGYLMEIKSRVMEYAAGDTS